MTNQNQNNQIQNAGGEGCIHFLSLIVFLWGAAMMYPKTADLLVKFAPNEMMGYTDIAGWWAMGSALLVEGVMVIGKIKMWIFPAKNLVEWVFDIILTFAPFVLSALCQVFDSMINQNTLKDQPVEIQFIVTWGVPLVPSVMIAILLGYSAIKSAPEGLFGFTLGNSNPNGGGGIFGGLSALGNGLSNWFGSTRVGKVLANANQSRNSQPVGKKGGGGSKPQAQPGANFPKANPTNTP